MRNLWKRTMIRAAVGLAMGLLIGLGFLALPGGKHGAGWVAAYLLICCAMGVINMGSTTLYEIERWSITRTTLAHLAITLTTFCGLALFLGWFRSGTIWIMLALFIGFYFVVWLVMYQSYRRQVRKMNEDLKRWKAAQGED